MIQSNRMFGNTGLGQLSARLRRKAGAFRRDESGSLLILSLLIFLVMLVASGIAIDIIRQEERRTHIQNTLDRAMLAAADLNQSLTPADVVRDYFDKSGLTHITVTPIVKEGDYHEWRSVEANVVDTMPTIFGPLVGVDSLPVKAQSRAEESIGNVEISLVLDVSGSMGEWVSGAKRITRLKSAANNFVDSMFDSVQPPGSLPGKLGISIVPYNQQVSIGDALADRYALSATLPATAPEKTCVDFSTSDFSTVAVSPTSTLTRTMYGDSYKTTQYWSSSSWRDCPEESQNTILAFSNDRTALKNKISGLTEGGNTAIDIGAKWGIALMDPSARPVLDSMVTAGLANNDLKGRPFDYDTPYVSDPALTSMKVLVLMTDGQNTTSTSTKAQYRTGPSGLVSSYSATNLDKDYLWYYNPAYSKPWYNFKYAKWYYPSAAPSKQYPITYETLWNTKKFTLRYAINTYLGVPSNNKTTLYNTMADVSSGTGKDTRLNTVCTKAKDEGIVVFAVAVDAPDEGRIVLEKCATAPAYAFAVTSEEMDTAFAIIASSINALRLTN